jgi:hypothetical protein
MHFEQRDSHLNIAILIWLASYIPEPSMATQSWSTGHGTTTRRGMLKIFRLLHVRMAFTMDCMGHRQRELGETTLFIIMLSGCISSYRMQGQLPMLCMEHSDLGYPHSNLLQMKFRNPPGWMRRDFNYHCDSGRVCAEWNFSCHCQQFPSVDTYRKMNMANMATGVLTTASVIIHNWHECTYGGLINDYFGVKPPTLERYFQL